MGTEVGDMANRKTDDERLERLMNHLADSVLSLSDDAILAEVTETGGDPEEEVERTRMVLREVSKAFAFDGPSHMSVESSIPRRKAPR